MYILNYVFFKLTPNNKRHLISPNDTPLPIPTVIAKAAVSYYIIIYTSHQSVVTLL